MSPWAIVAAYTAATLILAAVAAVEERRIRRLCRRVGPARGGEE